MRDENSALFTSILDNYNDILDKLCQLGIDPNVDPFEEIIRIIFPWQWHRTLYSPGSFPPQLRPPRRNVDYETASIANTRRSTITDMFGRSLVTPVSIPDKNFRSSRTFIG